MINAQIVLKTLCSVAKTSQEDLADALGISVTQAKRILKGSYDLPKFIKQDEFAQIFGRYCTDYFASDSKRMADEYLTSFRNEISDREYQEIEGIYRKGSYEALIKELWRKSYPDPNKNKRRTDEEASEAKAAPRPQPSESAFAPTGFTLRSLKALLTGVDVEGENWAAALKTDGQKPPESVHTPVILSDFEDDGAFLRSVFPESVLEILEEAHPAAVMGGTCKNVIKGRICRQLGSDCGISMRGLVKKCAALLELADLNAFHADTAYLFTVFGEENPASRRLRSCYRRCSDDNRTDRGLAVLAVFALLGPEHFLRLILKESDYGLFKQ